jgi:molybdenum cofactor synthesis domain-containing protein
MTQKTEDRYEHRMRPSRYALASLEEASRLVFENVTALENEEIGLTAGLNRVLAEDIYASDFMPPFNTTAVDGYALIAADNQNERKIIGEQTAGRITAPTVEPNTAVRIMTGAPLPPGADAVVMVEDTTEENNLVKIFSHPKTGDNIRPKGQDLQTGQLVLQAGAIVGAAELGLIATVNRPRFKAVRKPRIAILSTGDEIVEPGQPTTPGQIYDSNRYSLMSVVAGAYAEPILLGIAPDDEAGLRAKIAQAIHEHDALITSGGVSVGKLDLMKTLLEEIGQVHFGRVNLKPGKPITFVTVEVEGRTKPIFGLPGFPVSSLVSFELFVRPALLKMGGRKAIHRPVVQARLLHPLKHSQDRNEFVRAEINQEYDSQTHSYYYTARSTGAQNSSRLLSMLGANALLRLAPSPEPLAEGQSVPALLLDRADV